MRAYLESLHRRIELEEHPYFRALKKGEFDREDFLETQIQFFFAVTFFNRPMMGLAARLPHGRWRARLLENVGDEHGNGDLSQSHEKTFLTLLERLGVSVKEVESRALWPEVRAFNTCLAGVCGQDDLFTGLATLGIIEDLFAEISGRLHEGILARGWLKEEEMIHYGLHSELDEKHAEDFYEILDEAWGVDPRYEYQIEEGLELGAYIFLRLYRDLYEARKRRMMREVRGPHTAAGATGLVGF